MKKSNLFAYLQNSLTLTNATGTIFGPKHGTLSMGYLELTFCRICINLFGETLGQFALENWCGFLGGEKHPQTKLTQADYCKSLSL